MVAGINREVPDQCLSSPLRGQHHGVAVETVDVVVAPPLLLGVHTQSLAVHNLI